MEPLSTITTTILSTLASAAAKNAGSSIIEVFTKKKESASKLEAYLTRLTNRSAYFVTYRIARQHIKDAYVEPRIINSAITRTHIAPQDYKQMLDKNPDLDKGRLPDTETAMASTFSTVELEYIGVADLARASTDCLILGDGGDGKSALLGYLCWTRLNLPNPRVPIFIDSRQLRESALTKTIYDALTEAGLDAHSLPMLSKTLSVYVDGLDELPIEKYRQTCHEINSLNIEAPDMQFTVACRSGAYNGEFEHMRGVSIAPFTTEQADQFVHRWYADISDRPNANDLLSHLHSSDRLLELATKPLLLALICSAFRRYLNISRRPTALFRQCIDSLLWEWDAKRLVQREGSFASLDLEKQVWLHSLLAVTLHNERMRYCTRATPLALLSRDLPKFGIDSLNSESVLDELVAHHSIFVKWTEDTYGFSHLAIQEFLAACWYRADKRWEGLITAERISDPWWQHVIALSLASMDDATEPLCQLYHDNRVDEVRRTQVAAHCLRYDPVIETELRNEIVSKILNWYHNRDSHHRAIAIEMLVGMEDEWTSPVIRRSLAGTLTESDINTILRKRNSHT